MLNRKNKDHQWIIFDFIKSRMYLHYIFELDGVSEDGITFEYNVFEKKSSFIIS